MKITRPAPPVPTPAETHMGAIINFFDPRTETAPVDRRRVLQALAFTGISTATGVALWDTAQPKKTVEYQAPRFRPTRETSVAFGQWKDLSHIAKKSFSALSSLHRDLFQRTTKVSYKYNTSRTEKKCTGSGEDRRCTTKTITETHSASEQRTFYMDDALAPLKHDRLSRFLEKWEQLNEIVTLIQGEDLKKIVGETEPSNPANLPNDEFAEHFGFTWVEGELSQSKQALLTASIGLPASLLFFFYKHVGYGIANFISFFTKSHVKRPSDLTDPFRYPDAFSSEDERKNAETSITRRALFQGIFGVGAAALAFGSRDHYKERSLRISEKGRSAMREKVIEGNELDQDQLFLALFHSTPNEMMTELEDAIHRLRQLDVETVDKAVRKGIDKIQQKAKETLRATRAGAYSEDYVDIKTGKYFSTSRLQDYSQSVLDYNTQIIRDYATLANTSADELEDVLGQMRTLFARGQVPEELRPLLRAYYITTGVNEAVATEHSEHMWGLSKDLALLTAPVITALALSEMEGSHHETASNLVHGIIDWWDRGKLTVGQILTGMKQNYTARQYQKIYSDDDIKESVAAYLKDMRDAIKDLTRLGIVHDPVLRAYLDSKAQRDELQDLKTQLDRLDSNDVINVYIEKAFVFFAKKQLNLASLKEDILSRKSTSDNLVKNPDFDDFKDKVSDLIREAGPGFIFDLIESGVIEDNEPNENWHTAEAHELDSLIHNWATRVAGSVASVSNMYVALNVLPRSWFGTTQNPPKIRITEEDVIQAFDQYVVEKLKDNSFYNQISKELKSAMNLGDSMDTTRRERLIERTEIAKRVFLRFIEEARHGQHEWEILSQYCPKLREALASV